VSDAVTPKVLDPNTVEEDAADPDSDFDGDEKLNPVEEEEDGGAKEVCPNAN